MRKCDHWAEARVGFELYASKLFHVTNSVRKCSQGDGPEPAHQLPPSAIGGGAWMKFLAGPLEGAGGHGVPRLRMTVLRTLMLRSG
jgi:hypothetical protein